MTDDISYNIDRAWFVFFCVLTIGLVWTAAIVAAPWLMSQDHYLSSLMLYRGFSVVCHQIPERSFHISGLPFGVCSRCTGIYSGLMVGLVLYPAIRNLSATDLPSKWWLICSAIPMILDVSAGFLGIYEGSNISRLLTGLAFGTVAAYFFMPGVGAASAIKFHNQTQETRNG